MTFLQNDDPRIKLKDFLEKHGIRNYDDITAYVLKGVENIDDKRSFEKMCRCALKMRITNRIFRAAVSKVCSER